MSQNPRRADRLRRYWDSQAASYDRQIGFWDRHLFGGSREWVCSRAAGQVLEVAIGTGLNLPHYRDGISLTGVDHSPAMLDAASRRARQLGMQADLRHGDAHALEFAAGTFDSVVCTFGLCAIADHGVAIREMVRVLRPGGQLLLADHVAAAWWPVRAAQAVAELVSIPASGEYFRRRPLTQVLALGLSVGDRDRFSLGIVERLAATKP